MTPYSGPTTTDDGRQTPWTPRPPSPRVREVGVSEAPSQSSCNRPFRGVQSPSRLSDVLEVGESVGQVRSRRVRILDGERRRSEVVLSDRTQTRNRPAGPPDTKGRPSKNYWSPITRNFPRGRDRFVTCGTWGCGVFLSPRWGSTSTFEGLSDTSEGFSFNVSLWSRGSTPSWDTNHGPHSTPTKTKTPRPNRASFLYVPVSVPRGI